MKYIVIPDQDDKAVFIPIDNIAYVSSFSDHTRVYLRQIAAITSLTHAWYVVTNLSPSEVMQRIRAEE